MIHITGTSKSVQRLRSMVSFWRQCAVNCRISTPKRAFRVGIVFAIILTNHTISRKEPVEMKRQLMAFTVRVACILLALRLCGLASGSTYIAFTSPREGNNEIYIMDTNRKHLQNLTNTPQEIGTPHSHPMDSGWLLFLIGVARTEFI